MVIENKNTRLLVIPARGNSKRIKNKNIKFFFNKPIIYYILETAIKSKLFSKIHVSTESTKIVKVVEKKIPVDFYRPKILSTSKVPLVKVLRFVLKKYEELGSKFDEIWCILPCSPLIDVRDLKNISKKLFKIKKPLITVCRFPCPIEWAMKVKKSKLVPLSKKKLLMNSQCFSHKYYDTGQISASLVKDFKKIKKNEIMSSFHAYFMPPEKSVDIDYKEDWNFAKILYKGLKYIDK
jgi:pseudaminic acid cytidylyltransferase